MFSHTTIRHSYDFSQQIHQMAIEASQPKSEDAALDVSRREHVERQDNVITKFFRTLREIFDKA